MDWDLAIKRNAAELVGLVLWMLARLGPAGQGDALPRAAHLSILRVLRGVESAVRRLIVVAARDLSAKAGPVRRMPQAIARSGTAPDRIPPLALFDRRKRFDRSRRRPRSEPRIFVFGFDEVEPQRVRADPPGATMNGGTLLRRLRSVQHALETLPKQALRLARWRARRAAKAAARGEIPMPFSPMRPGFPPGYRMDRQTPIHATLRECDRLARMAENGRVPA